MDKATTDLTEKRAEAAVATGAEEQQGSPDRSRKNREVRPFPSRTLEDCLKIVEAIKTQNAGNPWPPDAIAKAIRIKSRSSNLQEIVRSANLYGLITCTYRAVTIELTELGKRLAYPENDDEFERAKGEAVLNVDLFARVIRHYKGSELPGSPYINNTLTREFNLNADFHDEFLAVLRKNIEFVRVEAAPASQQSGASGAAEITTSRSKATNKEGTRAFIIMPFSESEKPDRPEGFFGEVFEAIIKPACDQAGVRASTADRKGSDVIHHTILREIVEADIVVADLTDHNPNVMFELGLRMAEGKPVCIIKSKDTGRIFDVDNVLRVYDYNQNMWPSTVKKDVPELAEHIRATWEARNTGSSYVEILTGRSGANST